MQKMTIKIKHPLESSHSSIQEDISLLFGFNQFKLLKFFIRHVSQLFNHPMGQFLHIRIIKIRQGSFYILYDLTSNFRQ